MTDGNLTVKGGFITWGLWVVAATLIVVDLVLALTSPHHPHMTAGPIGNVGIYLAGLAATWTGCACVHAVGRQVLAELVRTRREGAAERDRVHVLQ